MENFSNFLKLQNLLYISASACCAKQSLLFDKISSTACTMYCFDSKRSTTTKIQKSFWIEQPEKQKVF